jgi:hypothetical protein
MSESLISQSERFEQALAAVEKETRLSTLKFLALVVRLFIAGFIVGLVVGGVIGWALS